MTRRSFPLTGVLALTLLALSLVTPVALADSGDDGDVIFRNQTRKTQHVLVRHGDGAECTDKAEKTQLELAPGESIELAAADNVCWCHSSFGKIGECADWRKAKPGSLQRIR
jgi:hypothetical protein